MSKQQHWTLNIIKRGKYLNCRKCDFRFACSSLPTKKLDVAAGKIAYRCREGQIPRKGDALMNKFTSHLYFYFLTSSHTSNEFCSSSLVADITIVWEFGKDLENNKVIMEWSCSLRKFLFWWALSSLHFLFYRLFLLSRKPPTAFHLLMFVRLAVRWLAVR
jgi:hypothetical protein